jgi:4-hydroxybenzoate polyprenyltransferase
MPALVLAVALVGATSLSVAPQFALVTASAIAFSLVTYPLLVRYTLVGQVLNGRRRRARRPWPLASKPVLKDVSG